MHRKFGNCWSEYTDPIHLMNRSSNMEIGLCWYKKKPNQQSTYDLSNYLMMDLEIIIGLASMLYIAYLEGYELHWVIKISSTTL